MRSSIAQKMGTIYLMAQINNIKYISVPLALQRYKIHNISYICTSKQ